MSDFQRAAMRAAATMEWILAVLCFHGNIDRRPLTAVAVAIVLVILGAILWRQSNV